MYAESEEAKMKKIPACLCIMAVPMFFAFFLFYAWSKKVYEAGDVYKRQAAVCGVLFWQKGIRNALYIT